MTAKTIVAKWEKWAEDRRLSWFDIVKKAARELARAQKRIKELEKKLEEPCKDCPGLGLMASRGWVVGGGMRPNTQSAQQKTLPVTVVQVEEKK